MSHFNYHLAELLPMLNEIEAFLCGLQPVQDMRDYWHNLVLREELRGINEILV